MNLWEEQFLLMWHGKGITYSDVTLMHTQRRKWFLERVVTQIKKENDASKRGANKVRRR